MQNFAKPQASNCHLTEKENSLDFKSQKGNPNQWVIVFSSTFMKASGISNTAKKRLINNNQSLFKMVFSYGFQKVLVLNYLPLN